MSCAYIKILISNYIIDAIFVLHYKFIEYVKVSIRKTFTKFGENLVTNGSFNWN